MRGFGEASRQWQNHARASVDRYMCNQVWNMSSHLTRRKSATCYEEGKVSTLMLKVLSEKLGCDTRWFETIALVSFVIPEIPCYREGGMTHCRGHNKSMYRVVQKFVDFSLGTT